MRPKEKYIMKKGRNMGNNNHKTKAFSTNSGKKKGFKNNKSRQRLVTAIFVVIILILLSLSALIIGKIVNTLNPQPSVTTPPSNDTIQVYKDAGDVHIGSLVLVNSSSPFNYEINGMTNTLNSAKPEESILPESLVNLWIYKFSNSNNDSDTKITLPNGTKVATYGLGSLATSTVLHTDALNAFNKMLLDYCGTLDLTSVSGDSASGINVAWGWSDSEEIKNDVKDNPNSPFYDHSTGMTLTLRDSHNQTITEEVLKSDHKWIYDNAHKYGFVIRYTTECGCERENSAVRLRYVGYEHAYYMTQNGLCLEEYLALVREHHKYSGEHLTFTADGKTYEVYYVACTGDPTSISVPKNCEYTISGDNMNGFIVTVVK